MVSDSLADGVAQKSLSDELDAVAATRVNALPSVVAERAAALRHRLVRTDEDKCDAYTTDATPGYVPGCPVEVKAVRVEHHDMTGRIGVHPGSHATLAEAGGWYCVVLYGEVDVDGRRIVVLAMDLLPHGVVGQYIRSDADCYQKVRWDQLLDAEVDRSRWSR